MPLISYKEEKCEKNTVHKHLKHKKKRVSTLRYKNPSLLKGFKRLLTGGSCGLPLEAGHLDNVRFVTT
jgi:hypothetical protein